MLSGRLNRIAQDILEEFSTFQITEKLTEAQTLSTHRANPNSQYSRQARELRAWAQNVIAKSKFNRYPDVLRTLLKESAYATALPENIAQVILAGFPDNLHLAISSSEISLYLNLVNATRAELSAFLAASNKFSVEEIVVPPNEISLDVVIPRQVFENQTAVYIDVLSRFSRIMTYMTELTTGTARSPTLTYTSTSDPVTGFAMVCGTAWAVLGLYKLLLEVAEKQLTLLKMIKDFRASALASVPDLDDRIKVTVEEALQAALQKTMATVQPKVPENRVNEIKAA